MMNYKGTPLFGQDSSPKNTSEFFALGGTVLFWLIFTLLMLFVKPLPQKPKYKEVQIVLSSTPLVKETAAEPAPAAAAPASAPAPVAEPAPVVEKAAPKAVEPAKTVESPKPTAQPKPAEKPKTKPAEPKKSETVQKTQPKPKAETPKPAPAPAPKPTPAPAPVQEEPVQLYQDPMEAFAQQTKKHPKQEFNWDMFEDEASEVASSSTQTAQVVSNAPSFEGSAGTAASEKSPALTSKATESGASQNNAVSSQTSSALSGITNAKYLGRAASGVSSETSVKTQASGSGKVALEMSNGTMRALLKPATPAINLSEQAAATIDSSRTVTIKFRVVEAGNVPRAEISIEPESTLHQLVRDEIRDQVSSWLFEAADYSAYASFTYKIVKQ